MTTKNYSNKKSSKKINRNKSNSSIQKKYHKKRKISTKKNRKGKNIKKSSLKSHVNKKYIGFNSLMGGFIRGSSIQQFLPTRLYSL